MKNNKRLLIAILLCAIFFICSGFIYAQDTVKNHHHKNHNQYVKKKLPSHEYRHLPKRGAIVRVLPNGSVKITAGSNYYCHNGIFYKPAKYSCYLIVNPPAGLRIGEIPSAKIELTINSALSYYYYGVYYTKALDGTYVVIEAPMGAIVNALPYGYDIKTIDEIDYYNMDGVLYKEVVIDNKNINYKVVGKE